MQNHIRETAHKLANKGDLVEIKGVVGHTHGLPTFSFTLAMGATFALVSLVWPFFGLAGIIAVIGSAIADLDAGQGWLRTLLTRDATNTAIVWPIDCRPGTHHEAKATLVIASPIEATASIENGNPHILMVALSCMLLSAVAVALTPWLGPYPSIAAATCLAFGSVAGWASGWFLKRKPRGNPALDVLLRAQEQCERTEHIRVVWALVGGGSVHHDGLRTLLLNHRAYLPPGDTRVLCIHPSTGVCSWVSTEGRIKTIPTDPLLGEIMASANVPHRAGNTGARKAHRLGWRSTGLCVSADQIHIGTRVVCATIERAESLAREGKW